MLQITAAAKCGTEWSGTVNISAAQLQMKSSVIRSCRHALCSEACLMRPTFSAVAHLTITLPLQKIQVATDYIHVN